MAKTFSYNRAEKLKSRKQLNDLFANGKSFTVFPVKVWYAFAKEQDAVLKTGVGVSSRNFKRAVHRNRVKRLLREAYRTQKQPLELYLNSTEKKLAIFLLFLDKTLPAYNLVKEKTGLCMQRLIKQLHEVDFKNI